MGSGSKGVGKKLIIAIDGPAGSGKSTIAAQLARKHGYINIETGAMYRALALKAVEGDVSLEDEAALLELARGSQIALEPTMTGNRVLLDGRDVSLRIREGDITDAASKVSIHPKVRAWMVERQREMGRDGGIVMEGRDIGTKVFPNADLKVFLDADPAVRGERRYKQQGPVEPVKAEALLQELRERDQRDRTRAASPLVPADDAVVIDSTNLTIEQVLERIEELMQSAARQ